jgi:hypothetical protein
LVKIKGYGYEFGHFDGHAPKRETHQTDSSVAIKRPFCLLAWVVVCAGVGGLQGGIAAYGGRVAVRDDVIAAIVSADADLSGPMFRIHRDGGGGVGDVGNWALAEGEANGLVDVLELLHLLRFLLDLLLSDF